MSPRRILVFFPQCPWPARSGAHRRCLDLLEGLVATGCRVRLLSTDSMPDGRWSEAGRDGLRSMGVEVGEVWRGCTRWEHHWLELRKRLRRSRSLLDDPSWTPRSLLRVLEEEIRGFRPDAVVHNYVHWWRMATVYRKARVPAAIEMHDLVTLNAALRRKLTDRLAVSGGEPSAEDPLLRSDFYDDPGLRPDAAEFRRIGLFPVVSCISSAERDQVDANCPASRSVLVPMTCPAVRRVPDLEGPAILSMGANPFNLQGLHVLARIVLPRVRARHPGFTVRVVGEVPAQAPRTPGLEYLGFVPDLAGELAKASFFVSPVFGGTGEQVKVLEGLASGLPVASLLGPFQESAVRDGVNGFRCASVDDLVEACCRLVEDALLRRRFGEAALEGVLRERSAAERDAGVRRLLDLLEEARP